MTNPQARRKAPAAKKSPEASTKQTQKSSKPTDYWRWARNAAIVVISLSIVHGGFWTMRLASVGMRVCAEHPEKALLFECNPLLYMSAEIEGCSSREAVIAGLNKQRWDANDRGCKMPSMFTPVMASVSWVGGQFESDSDIDAPVEDSEQPEETEEGSEIAVVSAAQ